jgi:hypothetical protein
MFHFPTFPPHALCVQARVTPHDWCGVPPFGHPRINARLAAPRGLTQPPTSFIGSWCPGIHRVPLTTWPHKKPHTPRARKDTCCAGLQLCKTEKEDARVHCAVLNQQPGTPAARPRQPHTPRCASGTRPDRPCKTTVARSLRTQQRAYNPRTRIDPGSTQPRRAAVLGAGASRRPNWSAFHPRALSADTRGHPVMGDRHGPSTALDRPT